MKFRTLLPLSLALALSACTSGQINSILPKPSASASPTSGTQTGKSVFSNALSKRLLPLNTAAQSGTAGGQQDASQPAAAPAPQLGRPATAESSSANKIAAPMVGDVATGASARMSMPWFGGGEFNQYVIQFAEENIFPANQASTLLKAYEQTVKPILAEWDSAARLVESRANLGLDGNSAFIEYISLPGADGKAEQLQPDYVFRFASSARKETLNVYLLKKETRVHRLVWGEPTIDLSKVKIDSSRAQEIATKAFTSRSSNPGYPVYPESLEQQPNLQIAYEVPANATWQIQLNQQGQDQNRYFVSVSFDLKMPAQPSPMPSSQVKEPALDPNGTRCFQVMPTYPEQSRVWGSAELDAASGEIKSLSRPTLYLPMYDAAMRCEGPLPVEPPKQIDPPKPIEPQPMPAETAVPGQTTTSSTQTQVSKG
ncbi:MAG: hypothetical protein AB7I41_03555 [Candidatus Sericytochromatia bacterium]